MIADRNSFLYDQASRTFYCALDPDYVGAVPNTIEIPRATYKGTPSDLVQFHLNKDRGVGIGFAEVYETREPNAMPYYILLYKDADLMRQHWRIQRERKR